MAILKLLGAFFVASITSGTVTAAISIFALGLGDPKFREAPQVAFELELIGVLIGSLVGAMVFAIGSLTLQNRIATGHAALKLCIACGVMYPVIMVIMGNALPKIWDAESLAIPAVAWTYLIAFPLLVVSLLVRAQRNAHREAGAL